MSTASATLSRPALSPWARSLHTGATVNKVFTASSDDMAALSWPAPGKLA